MMILKRSNYGTAHIKTLPGLLIQAGTLCSLKYQINNHSPVVYATSHERAPFDAMSQYQMYQNANLTSRFSPPKEITPFVVNEAKEMEYQNRMQSDAKSRSVAEFLKHLVKSPSLMLINL